MWWIDDRRTCGKHRWMSAEREERKTSSGIRLLSPMIESIYRISAASYP
jgi:hypothetical protein